MSLWPVQSPPNPSSLIAAVRPDTAVAVVCPGEYYAFQYLVEVFHVPESRLVLLPSHLQWGPKYPLYFLRFERAPLSVSYEREAYREQLLRNTLSVSPWFTLLIYFATLPWLAVGFHLVAEFNVVCVEL